MEIQISSSSNIGMKSESSSWKNPGTRITTKYTFKKGLAAKAAVERLLSRIDDEDFEDRKYAGDDPYKEYDAFRQKFCKKMGISFEAATGNTDEGLGAPGCFDDYMAACFAKWCIEAEQMARKIMRSHV